MSGLKRYYPDCDDSCIEIWLRPRKGEGKLWDYPDVCLSSDVSTLEKRITELESENSELLRWKKEALLVLSEWEKVWEAADRPGALGKSKSRAVVNYLYKLREERHPRVNSKK
jgi:hypothetical protein